MTKQDFLKLFELDEIYNKYQNKIPFCFGLHDNLIGTENAIFYVFNDDKLKLTVECLEFSHEIQQLELHLILNEAEIKINENEILKNEIFPFLTFDSNLDVSLKFIADFINKILKPKYHLMGGVSTY